MGLVMALVVAASVSSATKFKGKDTLVAIVVVTSDTMVTCFAPQGQHRQPPEYRIT